MIVYIATVMKETNYSGTLLVEQEAFDSMPKAEAFITSQGFTCSKFGNWQHQSNLDLEATIVPLVVR